MENLPLVSPEIGISIAQSLEDDEEYCKEQMDYLWEKNPTIAEFITKWANCCEEQFLHVALCGIFVYKLLESQAEANQMSQEINLG